MFFHPQCHKQLQANLIYALDVYAPKELVGVGCFTVLAVVSQEYVVECDAQDGVRTTENRYDKDWRPIKIENTE